MERKSEGRRNGEENRAVMKRGLLYERGEEEDVERRGQERGILISITASDNRNLAHCTLTVPVSALYMFKVWKALCRVQDCSPIEIAQTRLSDGKA